MWKERRNNLAYKQNKAWRTEWKLDVKDAEISIAKTSSKIMNESNPNFRNDELKKMIASLEKDLDDANAELDVAILEAQWDFFIPYYYPCCAPS